MANSVIFVFGLVVCIVGFLAVWLVYYFWKLDNPSNIDYRAPANALQGTGKENRQDARVDINWPVSLETPVGAVDAQVKNISMGGAFICCEKPLPIGEMFGLTIRSPHNDSLKATAKVVWSNVNVPINKVVNRGMGVRFIKMSDRHIQLVRQICQESV